MPNQTIVRWSTPEEEELQAKQAEVERLKEELARALEETETLKTRLIHFEAEYAAAFSPLYLRLDRWRLRCDELRWSIAQLRQRQAGAAQEDDIAHRQHVNEQFRRQWDEWRKAAEDQAAEPPPKPEVVLSPDDDAELRRIYRALAKRFHPDLAAGPVAKAEREKKMKQINAAYQAKDLAALRAMLNDPDIGDTEAESVANRLIRLIREIARVKRLVAEAQQAHEAMQASDLGRLAAEFDQAKARGGDGWSQLKSAVEAQIVEAKTEWGQLRAQETELWKETD